MFYKFANNPSIGRANDIGFSSYKINNLLLDWRTEKTSQQWLCDI